MDDNNDDGNEKQTRPFYESADMRYHTSAAWSTGMVLFGQVTAQNKNSLALGNWRGVGYSLGWAGLG